MDFFDYRGGVLHAEGVALPAIAAAVGTPVHVYSAGALRHAADAFTHALRALRSARFAFAVKANPNHAVLRLLAERGYGADIVSGGELRRALDAGMAASTIVFSGVGKTDRELTDALDAGIGQFNLELEEEGRVLAQLARARGVRAPAVLRVNPDVDGGTHAKITTGRRESKFGVDIAGAADMYDRLARLDGLDLQGIALHIGSQISDLAPLEAAYRRIGALIAQLRARGHPVTRVDLGGGLGIAYRPGDAVPSLDDYAAMVTRVTSGWDVSLTFEPGRIVTGPAGVLLTRVIWVKPGSSRPFVILDAAMNDLARPALYDAYHRFSAVTPDGSAMIANLAGPVCETGDMFGVDRSIDRVARGDLAVFHATGAYGAAMASSYNSRPLSPQVMVDGDSFRLVGTRLLPPEMAAAATGSGLSDGSGSSLPLGPGHGCCGLSDPPGGRQAEYPLDEACACGDRDVAVGGVAGADAATRRTEGAP